MCMRGGKSRYALIFPMYLQASDRHSHHAIRKKVPRSGDPAGAPLLWQKPPFVGFKHRQPPISHQRAGAELSNRLCTAHVPVNGMLYLGSIYTLSLPFFAYQLSFTHPHICSHSFCSCAPRHLRTLPTSSSTKRSISHQTRNSLPLGDRILVPCLHGSASNFHISLSGP